MTIDKNKQLAILRKPFEAHQISKLPKPTKAQTDEVKANFKSGVRCEICNGWHHPKVVHLDYVGHAALTDRLLEADPEWVWEPLAFDDRGIPVVDKDGGMWIRLTVCGVSRLGYGDSQEKTGANATKERIGDALRNAAMRFGAALDLWHKGILHMDEDEQEKEQPIKVSELHNQNYYDTLNLIRDSDSIETIASHLKSAVRDGASKNQLEELRRVATEMKARLIGELVK